MSLHLRRFTLAVLLTFLPLSLSYAWSALGHKVIANVAYQNLDSNVKNKVDTLVGYFTQEYTYMDSFEQLATWPDSIRSQRVESYTHWHYIDNPISFDGTSTRNNILDTDNAVWAYGNAQNVVQYTAANFFERVRFLAFFVHIVSDLHQPLHTVTYYSANHPEGDRGGNLFFVRFNNKKIKLHKLWDGAVGSFNQKPLDENAQEIANALMAVYPKSYFQGRLNKLDPQDWVDEGINNAKTVVYNTQENAPVSSGYIQSGKKLAEQEAVLAGYRLATLLNKLLG